MSMLLLPELARENAAANRRITHSVENLRQLQEDTVTRQRMASSAREAFRYTLVQAAEARSHWQGTMALLADGLEGEEAREVLQAVGEVFDSWFGLAKSTRDLLQTTVPAGTTAEGLEELDVAYRDIEALGTAAEEMRAFLNRARSPIDPIILEKARQAVAQGRYKTPEAIRARLRDRQG
jgi:hypothetical protein